MRYSIPSRKSNSEVDIWPNGWCRLRLARLVLGVAVGGSEHLISLLLSRVPAQSSKTLISLTIHRYPNIITMVIFDVECSAKLPPLLYCSSYVLSSEERQLTTMHLPWPHLTYLHLASAAAAVEPLSLYFLSQIMDASEQYKMGKR